MANIFDRLAAGPGNQRRGQSEFDDWNEMVGSAPPEKFGRSAYDAIRQTPSNEYYDHITPGVGGTDPIGDLPEPERQGLAQRVLGELFRRGVGQQDIMRGAGVQSLEPSSMSGLDLSRILGWTQREQPKAYGRVAEQYRDQPNILQSLMGNKAVMAMLVGLGAKMLMNRSRR